MHDHLRAVTNAVAEHPRSSPDARRRAVGRRRASFARGVQSRRRCSVRTVTSRRARRWRGCSSIASCWRSPARPRTRRRSSAARTTICSARRRRTARTGATTPSRTAGACTRPTGAAASPAARWRSRNCPRSRTRSLRDGVRVNLLGPSEATLRRARRRRVRLEQRTDYPFDGEVAIRVAPERTATFTIQVRIPQWAAGAGIRVNGASIASAAPAGRLVFRFGREWRKDDVITLSLPMRPQAHLRTQQQHAGIARARRLAGAPGSAALRLSRRHARPARVRDRSDRRLQDRRDAARADADRHERGSRPCPPQRRQKDLTSASVPLGRPALMFSPYYRAGGRRDRTWRLTWMPLAPESQ